MEKIDEIEKPGVLYIVATPIGNLGDMTYRAVETLKNVDLIVCEDTRTSKKLLDHYGISTPMMSFYQNIRKGGATKPVPKTDVIMNEILSGKDVAFITDAGTPGISDPGNQLIERIVSDQPSPRLRHGEACDMENAKSDMEHGTSDMGKDWIRVVPIPGASSLSALVSVAGIDMREFIFLGFPPHKKGRETFFKKIISAEFPVIYFESPHRVVKNLELLNSLAPKKNIILGRELTKMFEEIVRGIVDEVLEYFEKNPGKVKGEFVIIAY